MPRLYTHIDNHLGLQRDENGQEFISEEAAIAEAGRTAGSVLAEDVAAGRTPSSILITVEREDGEMVASISVRMAMDFSE